MIEYLGPLLVVLGPICFTLSANLDHFFSLPDAELNGVDDLEKEHIQMNLSKIFESVRKDSFKDPYWIESFQKYYHKNIKDLRDVENYFRSLSINVKHIKIGIIILGMTFVSVGAIYTISINLKIFESPRDLILIMETFFVFFLASEIILVANCLRKYKHNSKEFSEILKSQSLLLRGMFMRGSGGSEEA